jgi:hypothetical protein
MLENITMYALVISVVGLVACYLTYLGVVRNNAGSQVMQDLAEQILAFQGGPDRPVDAFLQILRDQIDELDPIPEAKAHAATVLKHLADGWKLAPVLLERARRLIRYAATMSGAAMCGAVKCCARRSRSESGCGQRT